MAGSNLFLATTPAELRRIASDMESGKHKKDKDDYLVVLRKKQNAKTFSYEFDIKRINLKDIHLTPSQEKIMNYLLDNNNIGEKNGVYGVDLPSKVGIAGSHIRENLIALREKGLVIIRHQRNPQAQFKRITSYVFVPPNVVVDKDTAWVGYPKRM